MLYILYNIGFFILRKASIKTVYSVVSFFAALQYRISKKDREIVKKNLRIALPEAGEKEISAAAKKVFINFGKYLADFFSPACEDTEAMKTGFVFEGLKNVDEALKLGKGCIIVTGHFGNWELGGYLFSKLGYKLNVVVLNHADPRINDFFIQRRKKAGIKIASIGGAKDFCLSALARNEIIAIVGDRPYGEKGIDIQFFGRTAQIPRGAALFSLRTEAPIIIAFTYREDENELKYKMIFEKPVPINRSASTAEQLKEITQYFIKRFECYIRKYPSQWYMFSRIWND